jgi:hypothetical protein
MPDTEALPVTVIVPTLNEADNIDPLLTRLTAACESIGGGYEILIADGGSTDDTRGKTGQWEARAPVRFVAANSGHGISGDVLAAARWTAAGTWWSVGATSPAGRPRTGPGPGGSCPGAQASSPGPS